MSSFLRQAELAFAQVPPYSEQALVPPERTPERTPQRAPQGTHERTPKQTVTPAAKPPAGGIKHAGANLRSQDWSSLEKTLDAQGNAVLPGLLSAAQCDALAACYDDSARFRSRIVMSRHGFGQGEYQYFAYPLPDPIQTLREQAYTHLAPIANRWNTAMNNPVRYPPTHAGFLRRCHQAGQRRPTPLLLRYGPGDYNCLHQDLYGEHVFPLQMAILLSQPGTDYSGGEFVLTEQRPRMQSRVHVVPLNKGDAVVFAVNERPVQGARGVYRVKLRHGVSQVRQGRRHVLGVIFHDAA